MSGITSLRASGDRGAGGEEVSPGDKLLFGSPSGAAGLREGAAGPHVWVLGGSCAGGTYAVITQLTAPKLLVRLGWPDASLPADTVPSPGLLQSDADHCLFTVQPARELLPLLLGFSL